MPKAGTPQTPPQAPKAGPNDTTLGGPEKTPEIVSAAPPLVQEKPVDQVISEAEAIAAGSSPVRDPGLDSNSKDFRGATTDHFYGSGETPDPTPKEMIAGTPANPKTMALPTDEVSAFALIRSSDGMWRAVQYRIKGATVLQVRTKEPDLKALLAAQITDCLALDMPLFNDEEAPRE